LRLAKVVAGSIGAGLLIVEKPEEKGLGFVWVEVFEGNADAADGNAELTGGNAEDPDADGEAIGKADSGG
jgi:hypothetical protein